MLDAGGYFMHIKTLIPINQVESTALPRALANGLKTCPTRLKSLGADSRLDILTNSLALDQNWTRPAASRLKSMEIELKSIFLEAGFVDFVSKGATLNASWADASQAKLREAIIDLVFTKLGLNCENVFVLNASQRQQGFANLLPVLQQTLIDQEIERMLVMKLGVKEEDVNASLSLNPQKGLDDGKALDLTEEQKRQFLTEVAVNFDIDDAQLIRDFALGDFENLSCLVEAVLSQTHTKHGIPSILDT